MSLDLEAVRGAVSDAIAAGGVKARDYTSESITPPCAVVVPANPYVRYPGPGQALAFGTVVVRLDVLMLVAQDSAKSTSGRADDVIGGTLAALTGAGYEPSDVTQPGVVNLSGAKFIGAVTTVEIHQET